MKSRWAGAALLALVPLTSCSASDVTVSVADIRETAQAAGESPEDCPVPFDVAAALDAAGARGEAELVEAEAVASERTEPAEDPVRAQMEDGLSPIQAAAGSSITCRYSVPGGELEVELLVSPSPKMHAAAMYLPAFVQSDGDSPDRDEVADLLERLVEPGQHAELSPDGDAVIVSLPVADDAGSAALWVESDAVQGDALLSLADRLVDDLDPA